MKYIENDNWGEAIGKHVIYLAQVRTLRRHFTIKILFDNDSCFTVSMYALYLPDDHGIHIKCFRSITNVLVLQFFFLFFFFMKLDYSIYDLEFKIQ